MKSNITKQIISAIRQCSYVGFRLDGRETSIEIVKRAESFDKTKFPFAQDVRVSEVVETKIEDYTKGHENKKDVQYKGWASENGSDYRSTCVNLLGNILKENDCLVARWIVSNSS